MNPAEENREGGIRLRLLRDEPHRCPYLPGKIAMDEFAWFGETLSGELYEALMNRGFRRSGHIVYRPICDGCRECISIRVPVSGFRPSRSQRRVWKRNPDVTVEAGDPVLTDEKWSLFQRYLSYQHDGSMSNSRESLENFLYRSPTSTVEMTYRAGAKIVGVGIVDVTPAGLSSVYFYFEPAEAARSPGVFSALYEIEVCRREGIAYWYGGYYVRDCRRMNYKANFGPYELLNDGVWRTPEQHAGRAAPGGEP